jgi:hypothetical protein
VNRLDPKDVHNLFYWALVESIEGMNEAALEHLNDAVRYKESSEGSSNVSWAELLKLRARVKRDLLLYEDSLADLELADARDHWNGQLHLELLAILRLLNLS